MWRASPRDTVVDWGLREVMPVYISASMSLKASVLSPTRAWSWLSAYPMHLSPHLLLVSVCTMWPMSHSSSLFSLIILIHMSGTAIASL